MAGSILIVGLVAGGAAPLGLAAGVPGSQVAAAPAPPRQAALQNELLREHFRLLYPFNSVTGRSPVSDEFVESYVDGQIENLLHKVDEQLLQLDAAVEAVARLRRHALAPEAGRQGREALQALLPALKTVEEDADSLYDYLGLALPPFWEKRTFQSPEKGSYSRERLFAEQFEYLRDRNRSAQLQVRNYFFANVATVSLTELEGETMLSALHSVREMARWLRKRLD